MVHIAGVNVRRTPLVTAPGQTAMRPAPHSGRRRRARRKQMPVRPLTLFTATAAVALLVVAGCEAKVQAMANSAPTYAAPSLLSSQPPPQLSELLFESMTASQAAPSKGFV